MAIRDYKPEDAEAIKAIHFEQNLDYDYPNVDSPLFLVRKVQVIDGRVVAALMYRITAEAYLFVQGGPRDKMAAMEELQPEALKEAWEKGLDDVSCVVPPTILSRFRKRLGQLGWSQDRPGWTLWTRQVTDAISEQRGGSCSKDGE